MKTREQMIEAVESYGRYNLIVLSREITEFLADFALEQIQEAIAAEQSVDMLLYCPMCFEQHVDEATPNMCQECGWHRQDHVADNDGACRAFTAWLNPPHKSHRCKFCNHVWRPADVPTNGVLTLKTQGNADGSARPVAFANGADFTAAVEIVKGGGDD